MAYLTDTEIQVRASKSGGNFDYEGSNWRVLSLEGLDMPQIEIFSDKKGQGNGVLITGQRLDARDIIIKARSQKKSRIAQDRADAITFHDPTMTYTLKIFYMGKFATLEGCILQGIKCTNPKTSRQCELDVSFLQADPVIATTGYYADETVHPTGDTISGTMKYYPLTNVYSEEVPIRKYEWTATADISSIYIGGNYIYFGTGSWQKIPAGATIKLVQLEKNGSGYDQIAVYVNGVLKKVQIGMTLGTTKSGTASKERVSLREYWSTTQTYAQPTDLVVEYAHQGSSNVLGI